MINNLKNKPGSFSPLFLFLTSLWQTTEATASKLQERLHRPGIDLDYATVHLHPEFCRQLNATACQEMDQRVLQQKMEFVGGQKVMVILLDIVTDRPKPPKEHYEKLLNGPGKDSEINPTGSVQQYLEQNSYGKFQAEFTIHGWTQAAGNETTCSGSNQGAHPGFVNCFVPALEELEARHRDFDDPFTWFDYDVNADGFIDHLIILHNGYNGESGGDDEDGTPPSGRIRSYAAVAFVPNWKSPWSGLEIGYYATTSAYRGLGGSKIARFNVLLHEYVHTSGMIDLYDVDFVGNGIGGYGLMGYPVGQANDATNPANVSPYTKMFLKWLEPIDIKNDGRYSIESSFTSDQIYKVSTGLPDGEYFLIENKIAAGWDINMWGGGGIVIWHVDENYNVVNKEEAVVSVVQADGKDDLENKVNLGDERDLWKDGGSKSELSDSGYPNTKSRRTGKPSGIRIYDFSGFGNIMEFSIGGVGPPLETDPPTKNPTKVPIRAPTKAPTKNPTKAPTKAPSNKNPTTAPTKTPTKNPTKAPTKNPAKAPTKPPTNAITEDPIPTVTPTKNPTKKPTFPLFTLAPVMTTPTLTQASVTTTPTTASSSLIFPTPKSTRAPFVPTDGTESPLILIPATSVPTTTTYDPKTTKPPFAILHSTTPAAPFIPTDGTESPLILIPATSAPTSTTDDPKTTKLPFAILHSATPAPSSLTDNSLIEQKSLQKKDAGLSNGAIIGISAAAAVAAFFLLGKRGQQDDDPLSSVNSLKGNKGADTDDEENFFDEE